MMENRDALDVREAAQVVRALKADMLEGLDVGLYHGAMTPDERRRVHADFTHRRLQVLVATARLEEGPAIPGATQVVIEQAESVEGWRLHRIIGFFSSGGPPARTMLVAGDLILQDDLQRLEGLQTAPSGVAYTELRARAEGLDDDVAARMPPLPRLDWLDLDADLDILLDARAEAVRLLNADPGLRRGPHAELAREVLDRFGELWPESDPEQWAAPKLEPSGDSGRRRRRRRRRKR